MIGRVAQMYIQDHLQQLIYRTELSFDNDRDAVTKAILSEAINLRVTERMNRLKPTAAEIVEWFFSEVIAEFSHSTGAELGKIEITNEGLDQ